MAVNLSDIAAMGGLPSWCIISLGLPRAHARTVRALYRGIEEIATTFGVAVVGGNLSRSAVLFVDVFMLGSVEKDRLTLRSTARPGDAIYVTGSLGGSQKGRHLSFTPRIREARRLIGKAPVTAMMDISDGLSSDLARMARASGAGFRLDADAIPVSPDISRARANARAAVRHALNDGEDYELLFTVPPEGVRQVPHTVFSVPVTRVGEITAARKYRVLFHGREETLPDDGYDHFPASR